ncbi:MAG: pentapeptide repeat-containing protein [Xanthomonadales bacterium]|nr:pentapeptide repeat-containing protein [Xanthomonadales bacterium]
MADGLERGRESIRIRYRWLYTWLGANLSGANLPSANLPSANLPGANLQVCTCGEA